jgi:hypothetical protein
MPGGGVDRQDGDRRAYRDRIHGVPRRALRDPAPTTPYHLLPAPKQRNRIHRVRQAKPYSDTEAERITGRDTSMRWVVPQTVTEMKRPA